MFKVVVLFMSRQRLLATHQRLFQTDLNINKDHHCWCFPAVSGEESEVYKPEGSTSSEEQNQERASLGQTVNAELCWNILMDLRASVQEAIRTLVLPACLIHQSIFWPN